MSPDGTLPKRYPIQKSKSNTYAGSNSHTLGHNATRCRPPSRVSPELSPHVLYTPLLQTLDCSGHRAGGIRGRVTARRIKEYTISDGWPSQLILVIIIFNINIQIRPAIAQVDWFGTREYRLSGSVYHAFNIQQRTLRASEQRVHSLSDHRRQPYELEDVPRNEY